MSKVRNERQTRLVSIQTLIHEFFGRTSGQVVESKRGTQHWSALLSLFLERVQCLFGAMTRNVV
jgi:hypothetical protein